MCPGRGPEVFRPRPRGLVFSAVPVAQHVTIRHEPQGRSMHTDPLMTYSAQQGPLAMRFAPYDSVVAAVHRLGRSDSSTALRGKSAVRVSEAMSRPQHDTTSESARWSSALRCCQRSACREIIWGMCQRSMDPRGPLEASSTSGTELLNNADATIHRRKCV